jgi:hypothetical protein
MEVYPFFGIGTHPKEDYINAPPFYETKEDLDLADKNWNESFS